MPDPESLRNHPENPMTRILLAGALALVLSACASPRDDGMGDLWKGVRFCNEGKCQ